jgi:hypothetical protein
MQIRVDSLKTFAQFVYILICGWWLFGKYFLALVSPNLLVLGQQHLICKKKLSSSSFSLSRNIKVVIQMQTLFSPERDRETEGRTRIVTECAFVCISFLSQTNNCYRTCFNGDAKVADVKEVKKKLCKWDIL